MNKKTMDIIINRFFQGGGFSERELNTIGTSVGSVLSVFKGNQHVHIAKKKISNCMYVTGRLLTEQGTIIQEVEPTLLNCNNEKYMEEELKKHEG